MDVITLYESGKPYSSTIVQSIEAAAKQRQKRSVEVLQTASVASVIYAVTSWRYRSKGRIVIGCFGLFAAGLGLAEAAHWNELLARMYLAYQGRASG